MSGFSNRSVPVTSVTGLGAGVQTFLTAPSSADLATALTDETGTGPAVFGTGPSISSPILTGIAGGGGAWPTIASADTIAPVSEVLYVSGILTINTITPPAPVAVNGGRITIIPTGLFSTGIAGNIALASAAVINKTLTLTYNPGDLKWRPSY